MSDDIPLLWPITEEELERRVHKGKMGVTYKTEWAKDEDGIARPVGSIPDEITDFRTGRKYYLSDKTLD